MKIDDQQGILNDKFPLDLYYAYAIKNSFGLAFDPLTGNLWDTEPGRLKNDELNIVIPGFNGGFGVMRGLPTRPCSTIRFCRFWRERKIQDPELVWYKTSSRLGWYSFHQIDSVNNTKMIYL